MEPKSFQIKTPVFEGPLDVLLDMIEKRKLLINDVSLAKVADDFINYIKNLDNFPIADTAHFILIASTLLLIKSRSLLPTIELSEEERGDIVNLEARLKLYQEIRRLTSEVKERFGLKPMFLLNPISIKPVFAPDNSISIGALSNSIKEVMNNLPKIQVLPKAIIKKVLSLEETISKLTERISNNLKISFRDFAGIGKTEKVNVIVSFLAMLELVKQGLISVKQENHFQDIEIENGLVKTPSYQ